MKNTGAYHDLYRRMRLSFREIAATVLLTLAACGFLIAALYGGGLRTGEDKTGPDGLSRFETVTIPSSPEVEPDNRQQSNLQ